LKEVPAPEAAGVVVRVRDWWNPRVPPLPQVTAPERDEHGLRLLEALVAMLTKMLGSSKGGCPRSEVVRGRR
jgi:hypothetical protein